MTKVKIKLIFLILNSLLAANARPYSDYNNNSTDIVIKYPNNNTFHLPVDPDSDTLVVANDDETAEDTNKSSKTSMDAMVNNEQNRDEALLLKSHKDQQDILGMPKSDADAIGKQLNISSSLLEEIIDSETDREETITDILFRPESEFADEPKFEFLIAAKINESDFTNKNISRKGGFSDNSIEKDGNSSDVMKKMDYVELVEVIKNSKENSSAYMANITGHEVDNDLAPDTSFTDLQTLFLACFGTLLPLLAVLFASLLIRCLCRRYCPSFCRKPTGSSTSESSGKNDINHQQLKCGTDETGSGIIDSDALPPNGSIFTMTLKNNHLIVETEERNDITKNGRETKMKYSPDNDGIFVVEVQQSSAYRSNNKSLQNSPPYDPQISTNQALIHRAPEEIEKKIEEDSERSSEKFDNKVLALSSTGLSISDLSMSSIGSHNVSYSYSSQMGYEQGPFGYPVYTGYEISKEDTDGLVNDNSQEPLISKTPTDPDKPVVTAAIFKQDSIISTEPQGYCIEGSTDGPLLSDVQAREYSLQHIQDQKKVQNGVAIAVNDKIESPKKTLNRADSLPVRLEKNIQPEIVTINSTVEDDMPKDVLKGKRASLPVIRTELCESVKDVIKSASPKFEKLMNEPAEMYDTPPLITITEESESSKSDTDLTS